MDCKHLSTHPSRFPPRGDGPVTILSCPIEIEGEKSFSYSLFASKKSDTNIKARKRDKVEPVAQNLVQREPLREIDPNVIIPTNIYAVVGTLTNKKRYKLPGQLICAKSDLFYRICCEQTTPEDLNRGFVINLAHLTPQIFDTILTWVNNDTYQLPVPFNKVALLAVYNAARFLRMPGLYHRILNAIEEQIALDMDAPREMRAIVAPSTLLQTLCQRAQKEDWWYLQGIAQVLYPYHGLREGWIENLAGDKENNHNYFSALVIDTLQRSLVEVKGLENGRINEKKSTAGK